MCWQPLMMWIEPGLCFRHCTECSFAQGAGSGFGAGLLSHRLGVLGLQDTPSAGLSKSIVRSFDVRANPHVHGLR
jgi:hypothetical protein